MGNERKMPSGMRPPAALFQLMFFALVFLVCEARLFTNHWAVRVTGGQENADQVAEKYGFLNMGQVCDFNSVFVFPEKHAFFACCGFKR